MMPQRLDYEGQSTARMPRRRTRAILIFAPLVVCTLLPVWTVWSIGSWEATGEAGTLWEALSRVPSNVRVAGMSYVGRLQVDNVRTAGSMLLLGFGIERFFVWRARRNR